MNKPIAPLLLTVAASFAGCQQYFRVTDIQTGKEFYAKSNGGGILPGRAGTAGFGDLVTGDRV